MKVFDKMMPRNNALLTGNRSLGHESFSDLAIVGGCGSSGTTLLAHLISRHPAIASGPEFNCFNHLDLYDVERLRRALPELLDGRARPCGYIDVPVFMTYRKYYGVNDELITSWVEKSENVVSMVGRINQHFREKFGGQLFFEKSPTNVYGMVRASETLPDVKLVHMIRDGRDVVPSLMRRGWNLFGAGSRWLYDTIRGIEARGAKNYYEIRYEDLVINPEGVLSEILAYLGFEAKGSSLLDGPANTPGQYDENWMERSEPKAWAQTPADPVSSKSVGKYKDVLTRRELDTLYRVRLRSGVIVNATLPQSFGELLDYLGYEAEVARQVPDMSFANRTLLQASDYWRRLRRFQN